MADGAANLAGTFILDTLARQPGQVSANLGVVGQYQENLLLELDLPISGQQEEVDPRGIGGGTGAAVIAKSLDEVWFEKLHIIPKEIEFGQILTTTSVTVEIYNAFREPTGNQDLTAFVNTVGAGLDITDLPALPYTILYLDGLEMTLQVTTEGVPSFDDILEFTFAIYSLFLPVSGLRVIVFPFIPEVPMIERLGFLTDVLEHQDGSEQRVSLRYAPRQSFDIKLIREEEVEKDQVENLLLNWQHRAFGVPVWYEPTILTSAATAGDTVINVESTAYADYRIGGLMIIRTDDRTFDSLEITAITATTITVASPLLNSYTAGTRVYPLRPCYAKRLIEGGRYQVGAAEYTIRFVVENNEVDLADNSAFSSYNSRVLLDDANAMAGLTEHGFLREIINIDNNTGKQSQDSPWALGKRQSVKKWEISKSRQKLWEVRQLLYFLKGRQVAFYLPTFQKDIVVTQTLLSGTNSMTFSNVGYHSYIAASSPKNIIRLTKTDGTQLIREILTTAAVSTTEESLTVDTNWPSNITVEEISKVEFLELVRINADEIRIDHLSAIGDAVIEVPVVTVFDDVT